jgi:hypothetical protein
MFTEKLHMNWLIFHSFVSLILTSFCRSEHDEPKSWETDHPSSSNFDGYSHLGTSYTSAGSTTKIRGPASNKMESSYWCNDQHEDFVHFIPGYVPMSPPSCWYSGYVSYEVAGTLIHTHYTLQTAELLAKDSKRSDADVENPFSKPLIYWSSYVWINLFSFFVASLVVP